MSVKASFNRFSLDAETVLRAAGSAAITSTGGSGGLALDALTAYWNAGDVANSHEMAVVVQVEAVDTVTGDETYVFAIEVDSVADFSDTPTKLVTRTVTAAGRFVLMVTREDLVGAGADAKYLRVHATIGGTTPSVTYNAYVAPVVGH